MNGKKEGFFYTSVKRSFLFNIYEVLFFAFSHCEWLFWKNIYHFVSFASKKGIPSQSARHFSRRPSGTGGRVV